MVTRQILDLFIGVRIPASQPSFLKMRSRTRTRRRGAEAILFHADLDPANVLALTSLVVFCPASPTSWFFRRNGGSHGTLNFL